MHVIDVLGVRHGAPLLVGKGEVAGGSTASATAAPIGIEAQLAAAPRGPHPPPAAIPTFGSPN